MSEVPTDVRFSRPVLGEREVAAVAEVLRSGWIVAGPRVEAFEKAFALQCGARFAVATSSWTAGAFLVLKSWGVGPGDEVIVPSLTFIATVNAIVHTGATPVFADIDPRTWNLSVSDAARKITKRTRVLLPVDQLGVPCDLPGFADLAATAGLKLLDDAACAFGSRIEDRPVGAFGDAAVFSLHARKVITTGEGGMIVTDDAGLAEKLRRLRHQGMSLSDYARHDLPPTQFETYSEVGYNFRMTDIQAAIGLSQLERVDEILSVRATLATRYTAALADNALFAPPFIPPHVHPNWQSYQVMLRDDARIGRNEVLERLHTAGIQARRGVMAAHLEPAYSYLKPDLPVTEWVASRTLQVPLHPQLTMREQDRVIACLQSLAAEFS